MARPPATVAIVVPFDVGGNAGTAAGAQLLSDALGEVLEDHELETHPIRGHAYARRVKIEELEFDTPEQIVDWGETSRTALTTALDRKEFILWLGGNHLSVLPVYETLGERDAEGTLVIQFDAHLDVYQLHDVKEGLANGTFLRHASGPLPMIVNLGHRDLFLPVKEIGETFTEAVSAEAWTLDPAGVTARLQSLVATAERVWIDIDTDVFDPAYAPAVHQPQPFGPSSLMLLVLLKAIWSPKIIGLSISEFDPGRDERDRTLQLLGWLIERVLLLRYEK